MLSKYYFMIFFIFLFFSCESRNEKKDEDQKKTEQEGVDSRFETEEKSMGGGREKTILFFGNSITAGYGLDVNQAFPALIQKKLDSINTLYEVINAGLSGETSAGGNSRIDWYLKKKIDIFVLELGGNDGLRGLGLADTRKNLQSILDKVKKKNPSVKIIIAGMKVPPNMGDEYALEFSSLYKELADQNKAVLIPFILDKVGGVPSLNLSDGIHPTEEGHQMVAETVWKSLKTQL